MTKMNTNEQSRSDSGKTIAGAMLTIFLIAAASLLVNLRPDGKMSFKLTEARADIAIYISNVDLTLNTNFLDNFVITVDPSAGIVNTVWSNSWCEGCISGMLSNNGVPPVFNFPAYTNGPLPHMDSNYLYLIWHFPSGYPSGTPSPWAQLGGTCNGTNYSTDFKYYNANGCTWGTNQPRLLKNTSGQTIGLTNFLYVPNCGFSPIRVHEESPITPAEEQFLQELEKRMNWDRARSKRYMGDGQIR